MAIAGAIGAAVGKASGNLVIAGRCWGWCWDWPVCTVVAPLYGGLIIDNLTREATSKVAGTALGHRPGNFRARESDRRRGAGVKRRARRPFARRVGQPARSGRVTRRRRRARRLASERAQQIVKELADSGKETGVSLLKSGVAQLSAFTLLVWALVGPPLGAAWECRSAKR